MASLSQLFQQAKTNEGATRIGIGGFTAYVTITEDVDYTSDAPTSYLEDGSFANDHIILKPIKLDITGSVSDIYLDDDRGSKIKNLIRRTQGEIGIVTKYLPTRTQAAVQRVNSLIGTAEDAYSAIDTYYNEGEQLLNFFANKTVGQNAKTISEQFFDFIEKTHYSKTLVKVETGYRTYKNMRITNNALSKDNKENTTGFKLTLHEMRFTATQFTAISTYAPNPSSGLGGSTSSEADKGTQRGKKVDSSLLYQGIHGSLLR